MVFRSLARVHLLREHDSSVVVARCVFLPPTAITLEALSGPGETASTLSRITSQRKEGLPQHPPEIKAPERGFSFPLAEIRLGASVDLFVLLATDFGGACCTIMPISLNLSLLKLVPRSQFHSVEVSDSEIPGRELPCARDAAERVTTVFVSPSRPLRTARYKTGIVNPLIRRGALASSYFVPAGHTIPTQLRLLCFV